MTDDRHWGHAEGAGIGDAGGVASNGRSMSAAASWLPCKGAGAAGTGGSGAPNEALCKASNDGVGGALQAGGGL